jgi:hypothetical protein
MGYPWLFQPSPVSHLVLNCCVLLCCATRPSRWLALDSMPSPYSYLSFHAGPRLCLGQRLAELEGVRAAKGATPAAELLILPCCITAAASAFGLRARTCLLDAMTYSSSKFRGSALMSYRV